MKTKCRAIKDLIYLYGDGELSDIEMHQLKSHISECSECSTAYRSVLNFKGVVNKSAVNTPEHYFTDTQADKILDSINRTEKTARVSKKSAGFSENSGVFFEHLLDIFYRPSIRFAMVFIILILAGTFMFQSSTTFRAVSELENKMQINSYPRSTSASVIDLDKMTGNLKDFYLFLKGDYSSLNLSSNLVIVDRNQFRNLFRIHNQLLNIYNKNPEEFSKLYPELTRYLSEQVEPEELDRMLSDKNLISDLNKILKGETK